MSYPEVLAVTPAEAAKRIMCSKAYIEKLLRRGDLPRIKLSATKVLISVAELQKFLDRKTVIRQNVAA